MARVIRNNPHQQRICNIHQVKTQPPRTVTIRLDVAGYREVRAWTGAGIVVDDQNNAYQIPNLAPHSEVVINKEITYLWQ